MTGEDSSPITAARGWAEALRAVINGRLSAVGAPYSAASVGDPGVLPQILRIGSTRSGDPSIGIMVEEVQGFLSIDRAPGVHVLYESKDYLTNCGRRSMTTRVTWCAPVAHRWIKWL